MRPDHAKTLKSPNIKVTLFTIKYSQKSNNVISFKHPTNIIIKKKISFFTLESL